MKTPAKIGPATVQLVQAQTPAISLPAYWDEACKYLVKKDRVDTNTDSSSREQSSGRSGKNRTGIQGPDELRTSSSVNEVAVKV